MTKTSAARQDGAADDGAAKEAISHSSPDRRVAFCSRATESIPATAARPPESVWARMITRAPEIPDSSMPCGLPPKASSCRSQHRRGGSAPNGQDDRHGDDEHQRQGTPAVEPIAITTSGISVNGSGVG